MGNYNPNLPTVLGQEFAPVATAPVALDTATAFGYTFRTVEQEGIVTARVLMTQPPSGNLNRKIMSVEVYPDSEIPGTGLLRKILVPVIGGGNITNAALVGGATHADCLRNPSDSKYWTLTGPGAFGRLWFDTGTTNAKIANALGNARIVDVAIRYAVSGPFASYVSPVVMSLERGAGFQVHPMDTNITGANANSDNTVLRRSRLGDFNPFWNTTANPNVSPLRGPWVYNDGDNNYQGLESMNAYTGDNYYIRFDTSAAVAAADVFRFEYVAMEITYCAETRVAAGAASLTAGVSTGASMFYVDVPLMSVTNWGYDWSSISGYDYAVVVGQGYVGAESVAYPVPLVVDRVIPSRTTFKGHRGVLLRKTIREGEEWTREATDSVPAVAMYSSTTTFDDTTVYPPSQVYSAPLTVAVDLLTFAGEAYAQIPDTVAGRSYTHVRFYARCLSTTRDYLRVYRSNISNVYVGPEARLTVEAFNALPEIVDGWKEVTLPLSVSWASTGGGTARWQFDSASDAPWQILGADSNKYETINGAYSAATYGGAVGYARVEGNSDYNGDVALMFIQSLAVPGSLAVGAAVQPLTVMDTACGQPVKAIPTGIRYHHVTWAAVNDIAVAGFAYYELQRRDTTMTAGDWETVAQISAVTVTSMDDYEARVGVQSSYRIRQVHEDGYTSAWSSTVNATLAAPGVTGAVDVSVLILTSNINPDGNLAYCQVWDGDGVPPQEFTYAEGGQTEFQQMYLRDYPVAFRPLERAGVSFTRNLLLNAAGVPTATLDGTARPLRDLAWDTVPYVCTRDQAAHRWLTALAVPSSASRDIPSAGHLVLAPVTFTEVTATPAPVDYDGGCEGVRLEGLDSYQYWSTPVPAVLNGTRVVTDSFTRTVANGWGSTTTGQAWTAAGGTAADFSTNGSVGSIVSATVTVDRRLTLPATYNYHRAKITLTVPAVATTNPFYVTLVTRYQDASNYYQVRLQFNTTGQFKLQLAKIVAGVTTVLDAGTNVNSYTTGTVINLEHMTRGTTITARTWRTGDTMPGWDDLAAGVTAVSDTSLAMSGKVGVEQTRAATNANTNLTVTYDNYSVDSLPLTYDWRALVRPFSDQFDVSYGVNNSITPNDSEGEWSVRASYGKLELLSFGRAYSQISTDFVADVGLFKNRAAWLRVETSQTNPDGTMSALFSTSTDGVSWGTVLSFTAPAPSQPLSPLAPGAYLTVENYDPGGIWTKRYELRVDGTLIASPDFAAQPPGTTSFTDAQGNLWTGPAGRGICATLG